MEYFERFGIYAVSGSESPLCLSHRAVRDEIVAAAADAGHARLEKQLHLGNLSESRDWDYAPEHEDAMWRMLQRDQPADYIATGESHAIEELAATVL